MTGKVSAETRDLIERLNEENLSLAEIARRANVSYTTVYVYTRTKRRGFASYGEYREHLAKQRQEQPGNQELSDLIKQRLAESGETQKWLATQLGITEGAVSRYASGRTTPKKDLQRRLFEALEVPYQTVNSRSIKETLFLILRKQEKVLFLRNGTEKWGLPSEGKIKRCKPLDVQAQQCIERLIAGITYGSFYHVFADDDNFIYFSACNYNGNPVSVNEGIRFVEFSLSSFFQKHPDEELQEELKYLKNKYDTLSGILRNIPCSLS